MGLFGLAKSVQCNVLFIYAVRLMALLNKGQYRNVT